MNLVTVLMVVTGYLLSVSGSCDSSKNKDATPAPPLDTIPSPNDPDMVILEFGTGSGGNLTIDGNNFDYPCKTGVRIKKGHYSGITIKNIQSTGCPLVVFSDGQVTLAGTRSAMTLANLNGVVITGDPNYGTAKDFVFENNSYRAIVMQGEISNVTLSNMAFRNVADYVISYDNTLRYTGQPGSFSENLKLLRMDCERCGQFIQFNGSISRNGLTGVYKSIEIAYLTYSDSPAAGNIVYINNAFDYNIHHNTIANVNSENNNHNAMFHLIGNGRFHNNLISSHQGNSIRAWTVSLGSTPQEVLIYNNIVYNSRKYSAFEVQGFSAYRIDEQTTYANAKIFNNTCGSLNTSRDNFPASVVDVYGLVGGTCEVFNNLGYDFPVRSARSDIWHPLGDTRISGSNNLYFDLFSQVGFTDATSFKPSIGSAAKSNGKATPVETDFYGSARHATNPSIGAVE